MVVGIKFWNKRGEVIIDSTEESFVLSNKSAFRSDRAFMAESLFGEIGPPPYFFRIPVGKGVVSDGQWYVSDQDGIEIKSLIPAAEYDDSAAKSGIRFWDRATGKRTWSTAAALMGVDNFFTASYALNTGMQPATFNSPGEWVCLTEFTFIRTTGNPSGQLYFDYRDGLGVRRLSSSLWEGYANRVQSFQISNPGQSPAIPRAYGNKVSFIIGF